MSHMSPRLRRLQLDHERLKTRFENWPLIEITGHAGLPPEQYQICYRLKGLFTSPDGQIIERDEHVAEINLSLGYPRRAPQCKMLTPLFHPNFDQSSICIGDFWAASEGLDDLVVRIGRMIAYQEYNAKSPLNGLAARWAAEHGNMLPVDDREIAPPLDRRAEHVEEKIVVEVPTNEPSNSDIGFVGAIDFGTGAYVLEDNVTTIGRDEGNLICIHSDKVSAFHAEIIRIPGGFVLREHSSNGTWIGELQIEGDVLLSDGDVLRFGDVRAQFSIKNDISRS